jgi:hypothetical protein
MWQPQKKIQLQDIPGVPTVLVMAGKIPHFGCVTQSQTDRHTQGGCTSTMVPAFQM